MHCMTETRCHCRKSERRGVLGAVHCLGSENVFSSSHECSMGRDGAEHAQMHWETLAILLQQCVPTHHSVPFRYSVLEP